MQISKEKEFKVNDYIFHEKNNLKQVCIEKNNIPIPKKKMKRKYPLPK